jgi:hypothetical protein
MGTQVNLTINQQAEFFTGTSDADLEWVQSLGSENPNTDIFLISGTWDDILTVESAGMLVEKLAGQPVEPSSFQVAKDPRRVILLTEKVLHNYEIYSTKGRIDDLLTTSFGQPFEFRNSLRDYVSFWFLGLSGLFLTLISANGLVKTSEPEVPTAEVRRLGWFIGGKLLLWFPALIPGALIGGLVFFAPLGTPAFNLYYIAFFGGYGVLLWFLYLKGKVPGVEGKIILKGNPDYDVQKSYLTGFVFLMVLLVVSLMARSGWWYTFPFNHRVIWLIVFTLINSISFVIGFKELEMLRASFPDKGWLVWVNGLVGLLPFFLYAGFLGALGSISGLVGNVQGLIILALVIVTGSLVYKISRRPWLAAILQAFLLYWLILPQGVLFR